MNLFDAGGAPRGLTLDSEFERRVVGAPDDLHGITAVAQHADVGVALGAGALEAAHDLQQRVAAMAHVQQVEAGVDLRAGTVLGFWIPCRRISIRKAGLESARTYISSIPRRANG